MKIIIYFEFHARRELAYQYIILILDYCFLLVYKFCSGDVRSVYLLPGIIVLFQIPLKKSFGVSYCLRTNQATFFSLSFNLGTTCF